MKINKIVFSLNMTNNCNLKCDYCIQTVKNNKNRIELNIDNAIEYIDKFVNEHKEYRTIRIEFFGGEPTLKRHKILDFLNKIVKKEYINKFEFIITTNGFIYFPEYFIFFKEHKINRFEMTISYDLLGQEKRSRNPIVNNIIKNNILKYKKLCIDLNLDMYSKIRIASCLTESNVDLLYYYFIELNYNLNISCFNITTVFPEYWKIESFRKLYKQIEKMYNHVIESRSKKIQLCRIKFPYKDISEKHNSVTDLKDTMTFDKVEVLPFDGNKNEYLFHKDLRGSIKNILKLKDESYDILENSYDYKFKNFEINVFKQYVCDYDFYNFMTVFLISGGNIKRYKNEIYGLMMYNTFLMKKYIKLIKRIRNYIEINILKEFNDNGILYFLYNTLDNSDANKIKNILSKNILILNMNSININKNPIKIIYDDNIKGFGYNNKNDTIYINRKNHNNLTDIQDTVLHEIFHLYLCYIGIDEILKSKNHQNIIELLCENFISIFKNYIFNVTYIK